MRRTRLLLTLLVVGTSCTAALPTSVTLEASDLAAVVLQEGEASEGLEYRRRQSGPEDLEKFARPGEQAGTLAANGFKGAYRVSLSTDAYVDYPSDPSRWTGIDLVENQMVALKDAGAARKVLEYYREFTVREEQSPDMEPFTVDDLGEQSYGLTGKIFGVAPAAIIYWRRGNVFSSLALIGTQDEVSTDQAAQVARTIDRRIAERG